MSFLWQYLFSKIGEMITDYVSISVLLPPLETSKILPSFPKLWFVHTYTGISDNITLSRFSLFPPNPQYIEWNYSKRIYAMLWDTRRLWWQVTKAFNLGFKLLCPKRKRTRMPQGLNWSPCQGSKYIGVCGGYNGYNGGGIILTWGRWRVA